MILWREYASIVLLETTPCILFLHASFAHQTQSAKVDRTLRLRKDNAG